MDSTIEGGLMEAATSTIATPIPAATRHSSAPRFKQLTLRGSIGVWAAAALPMGLLAWVGAPLLADQLSGSNRLSRALIVLLTAGLVWQFVLVMFLVKREQGTLRLSVLRDALWLRAPRSPKTGSRGGLVWLRLLPRAPPPAGPPLRGRGAHPDSFRSRGTRPRRLPLLPERALDARGLLGLVRRTGRAVDLQHRARRGAPLPRVSAPSHERRVRQAGLARKRCAVRPLPRARSVGHPGRAARARRGLRLEALSQRAHRHRRAQHAEHHPVRDRALLGAQGLSTRARLDLRRICI